MTLKSKSFAQLSDIVGLVFVCVECESFVTVDMKGYKNIPLDCPNCRKHWYADRSASYQEMQAHIKHLKSLQDSSESDGCTLLFEVKSES